jgi:hypothetical protein
VRLQSSWVPSAITPGATELAAFGHSTSPLKGTRLLLGGITSWYKLALLFVGADWGF